uniref:Uncharacterized protein n=1 Tax=Arion vulgaris TaxID=1028688 RepID=A0A0B7BP61_9EUPU
MIIDSSISVRISMKWTPEGERRKIKIMKMHDERKNAWNVFDIEYFGTLR